MNTNPTPVAPAADAAPVAKSPVTMWYPLFRHMGEAHGLTLIDSELADIALKADESRMKAAGGVAWILANCIYHLTSNELHELGDRVAFRSGGTYTMTPMAAQPCGLCGGTGRERVLEPEPAPVPATAPALTPEQVEILGHETRGVSIVCCGGADMHALEDAGFMEKVLDRPAWRGITEAGRRALREQGEAK